MNKLDNWVYISGKIGDVFYSAIQLYPFGIYEHQSNGISGCELEISDKIRFLIDWSLGTRFSEDEITVEGERYQFK